MATDPKANLSGSDSSSDTESEHDQVASEHDQVAKVDEEFISNENASSGLTVCHNYF